MQNRSLLVLSFLLLFILPAHAERIRLNSGQTINAKILKTQADSILVDAGLGTPVTYFQDEIKEILPDETAPVSAEIAAEADSLESQGLDAVDQGKMEDGLAMIRQSIVLDPKPIRYMTYGSILFGNGVSLFKDQNEEEARKVLRSAEEQLQKAISGFDRSKDVMFLAQSYFLLGEIQNNAFADLSQARENYQKALTFYDHDGAKSALAKLAQ